MIGPRIVKSEALLSSLWASDWCQTHSQVHTILNHIEAVWLPKQSCCLNLATKGLQRRRRCDLLEIKKAILILM
jgi:hypothetical protein